MNINTLLIELTQRCNLNCQYCFYRDYGRKQKELSFEQVNKILNDHINIKEIFFTGGECTLASNVVEIFKMASERAKVSIFTNGLRFLEEDFFSEINKYVSKYIITYDEYDESYFCRDRIKDTDLVIKKIISQCPEKLVVKICINMYNKDNLNNIIQYLADIGVKKISINLIHNIKSNNCNFELSKDELKEMFLILDSYKDILDINYYEEIKSFFLSENKSIVKNCKAGESFLYYDCEGNACPCPAECSASKKCLSKECISLFEMF